MSGEKKGINIKKKGNYLLYKKEKGKREKNKTI